MTGLGKALATVRQVLGDECGSWPVRHHPYSPHPPQCEVPGCAEHPESRVVWATDPQFDVRAAAIAPELPAGAAAMWVCGPCRRVIGATVTAAGYGHRVVLGGCPADRGIWRAEPVPAETLHRWLAASRRGVEQNLEG